MFEPGCEPSCDPSFTAGLIDLAGLNPHGQPILRCVSGEHAQRWLNGGWKLRYPKEAKEDWGFQYRGDDGQLHFVRHLIDVPVDKIGLAVKEEMEVGEPYQYVERWRSPEFLATTGRFKQRHDESGDELLPELPSEGHYDYFLRLECCDGSPHPADGVALNHVRAIWGYEHSTTRAEREEHLKKSRAIAAKIAQAARNDLWGYDPDDYILEERSDGHQKYVRRQKGI